MSRIQERWIPVFFFLFFATGAIAQSNVDFLEKVQKYQDAVKLDRTGEFPDLIDTSTFNTDDYFYFFNKLSLPTGSKLQYVFYDDKLGGCPILYLKNDSIKIENYLERKLGEYVKRYNLDKSKITQEFIDFKKYEILCGFASLPSKSARNNLTPKDSKKGYLQFLFFYQFGELFALKWHSNYGQKSVIFSKDEMKRRYDYYRGTDSFTCDMEKFENLLKLNPKPKIKMKKGICLITWYEIATHHGIYKRSYEISRLSPHSVVKTEDVEILKINTEFIY
uniref:hypothetical protein n=1 Tax=uncultured Draconibacterium sp. TaxID=1573823 RepID=UPI003216CD41